MEKLTWVKRYSKLLSKFDGKVPEKDLKTFAGLVAAERLEKAKADIKGIGSPFFGSVEYGGVKHTLPCSDKAISYLRKELFEAVDRLINDMTSGGRKERVDDIVPI